MFKYSNVKGLRDSGLLTEKESVVLDNVMDQLKIWEPNLERGFSDLEVDELSGITVIETTVLRGVISSLIKKGYLVINEVGDSFESVEVVSITEKTRGLY